jgi:hypothetical protein
VNSHRSRTEKRGLRSTPGTGVPYRGLYAMPVVWACGSKAGLPIPDERAVAGRADFISREVATP